jgi:soluble lytic murein transglycosylase
MSRPTPSWLKLLNRYTPWILSTGVSLLLIALGVWLAHRNGLLPTGQSTPPPLSVSGSQPDAPNTPTDTFLTQLALVPPEQRSPYLQKIIQDGTAQQQQRARFMLAADALQAKKGADALPLLKDLEQEYPALTSEILALRAKALQMNGKAQEAQTLWQTILKDYPKDAAAAEAFYALGTQTSSQWDRLLQEFPAHPLAVEVAVTRLKTKPDDRALLLLVARHGFHLDNQKTYLDRLVSKHGPSLTPEDWQAVAFAYWEKSGYKEAGQAYSRSPASALTRYRAARALHFADQRPGAIAAYQQMIAAYPDAKQTSNALVHLASLVDSPATKLELLDRAIQLAQAQKRPEKTAEALLAKAKILHQQKNSLAASALESQLIKQFGATEAAAEFQWQQVQAALKARNISAARDTSLALAQAAPRSSLAPQALFWAGKWSQQLGQGQTATQAWLLLWKEHPDSYYTWRTASLSGYSVGDFSTLRSLQPQPNWPNAQLPIATGSPTLQELYRLGQTEQAWRRWQVEFTNREEPTLAEQQTDGLIRIGVGEYLDGIYMLNNLDDRLAEEPDQTALVQQWREHPGFWFALYPLAYYSETAAWSQQVQINPLLVLGLIRQESRFETKIRSSANAVGLMQIIPETADWISQQLKTPKYNLETPSDNLRFGTWYFDYTHQTYNQNSALAIASYNAGPGAVSTWVKESKTQDMDEFIEAIPYDETRGYVEAVLANHWNYLRLYHPETTALANKLTGQALN